MAEKRIVNPPTRWGPWRLDITGHEEGRQGALVHDPTDYEIAVEDLSAEPIRWLSQVMGQKWAEAEELGWLVCAIRDLGAWPVETDSNERSST